MPKKSVKKVIKKAVRGALTLAECISGLTDKAISRMVATADNAVSSIRVTHDAAVKSAEGYTCLLWQSLIGLKAITQLQYVVGKDKAGQPVYAKTGGDVFRAERPKADKATLQAFRVWVGRIAAARAEVEGIALPKRKINRAKKEKKGDPERLAAGTYVKEESQKATLLQPNEAGFHAVFVAFGHDGMAALNTWYAPIKARFQAEQVHELRQKVGTKA